jgi:hypothetical protein
MARQKKSILSYWPFPSFRDSQKEILEAFERSLSTLDVAVFRVPVAGGKQPLAYTISKYLNDSAYIVPTNTLLNQFLDEFPSFPKLHKKDYYICPLFETEGHRCSYISTKFKNKVRCIDCEYKKDKKVAFTKYVGAYNYYTYMAMKLYHKNLIIDEGHNALKMLQDLAAKGFWQKDLGYPNWVYSYEALLDWVMSLEEPSPKQIELLNVVTAEKQTAILERGVEYLRGEREDLLRLVPISVEGHPPVLWPPHRVNKMILLSATISPIDIKDMGLDKDRKVVFFDVDSSIPIENKPLICDYIGKLNYFNASSKNKEMANKIIEIANYQNTRGLVHTTYGLARKLEEVLPKDRFLFHDKEGASKKFYDWKRGVYKHQAFIGCGFEEGVDLAGPEFGWQIITKIQYTSLTDPAIKYRVNEMGDYGKKWYVWNTLKKVMQSFGRICRGPEDYGETWIIDGSFDNLIERALEYDLVPSWFKEVLFPKVPDITQVSEVEKDVFDTLIF